MQNKTRLFRYISAILFVAFICPAFIYARDFVHIFTSKGIYETCEDMWFKCLVLNDSSLGLSDML